MIQIFEIIKSFFTNDGKDNPKKANKILRNAVILGIIGMLLLLSGNLFKIDNTDEKSDKLPVPDNRKELKKELSYEERMARELEEVLTVMEGVGRVNVIVYVNTYSRYDYEYNVSKTTKTTAESDTNGGERKIDEENNQREMVVTRDSSGSENPVLKKKEAPIISGVMIVAEGAEKSRLKYEITQSVSRLLGLPVHKISVLPYQNKERR